MEAIFENDLGLIINPLQIIKIEWYGCCAVWDLTNFSFVMSAVKKKKSHFS